ncbi:MAG TPA: hypothetical protein VFJ60_02355 [Gaiella sp.]|nr:hypothetical protein [Gaiella sp.]
MLAKVRKLDATPVPRPDVLAPAKFKRFPERKSKYDARSPRVTAPSRASGPGEKW